MKKLIAILALSSVAALAQSSHSVSLSWTPSTDTGGTVNVYRAPAACTANPTTFTPLANGIVAAGPYADTTVAVGAYCYYVTSVVNGAESLPSNKVTATVLPQSPTGLVVSVSN